MNIQILIWSLIFLFSIAVLVKSADFFTTYAEKLGRVLKMSEFIVGMLIVAIGTSVPELGTAISAVIQDKADIVIGEILGSNIANFTLALGFAALFAKGTFKGTWNVFYGDLPIFIGALILLFFSALDGEIGMIEALVLLVGYLIYLVYSKNLHKNSLIKQSEPFTWKIPILLISSLILIFLSSKYAIESVIQLSDLLGISTAILGTSLVALGTSLPEIVVAITAARKRKFDMVIGDVIGSNIFNTLAIIGVSGTVGTLPVTTEIFSLVMPFMIAIALFYWVSSTDKTNTRTEGAMMILLYFLFISKLFELF